MPLAYGVLAVPTGVQPAPFSSTGRRPGIRLRDRKLVAWPGIEPGDMNLMRVPSRLCSILASIWCKRLDLNQQTSTEDQFYRLLRLTVFASLAKWRRATEFNRHPFQEPSFSRRFASASAVLSKWRTVKEFNPHPFREPPGSSRIAEHRRYDPKLIPHHPHVRKSASIPLSVSVRGA